VASLPKNASDRIYAAVDWFIPANLKADGEIIQGARMFLFSHLFGPFLGHTISLYVLYVQGTPDQPWWIFFSAITAFWPFTFALRLTGWYVPLALVSIQNLIFCILWGCYHYGGISSPILPWLITVPLLAFFYLPTRKTRIIVSCLIVANLIAFYFIYNDLGFPDSIPLSKLSGLGMVSTFCAGVYVSMMALYYANIVSSQSELEQEIQRHLATARALQHATDQAERATRAKAEFLAKMSHELRTPLNAIIGYSEILVEDVAGNDHKSEDVRKIHHAGKKLLVLINDLLDLSKLEAGKMDVYPERFDLRLLVELIEAEWREPIAESGNEFVVECRAPLGEVVNEASKIRQVASNLLSNAAKFTSNGRITMTVGRDEQTIVIDVRDTGIGIDPERLANLFETFGSRGGETSSKYDENPGLGLPLSQRLCHLMGGVLTVESEVGRGSCFRMRIPADLAPERTITTAADPADANANGGSRVRPILVVNDDATILSTIERALTKEGLWPLLSSNPAEGLERARHLGPAAIILDVDMKEHSCSQVVKQIRDDPQLKSCPLILLTPDARATLGEAPAVDAYLSKPIDCDALLAAIKRLDGRHSAEQAMHPGEAA
jgi:signal transduction histidine kinase/ActR/RegA family two-component response regulator